MHSSKAPIQTPPKSRAKLLLSSVAIVGGLAAIVLISGIVRVLPQQKSVELPPKPGFYLVSHVFDGDTISVKMDGREEKVRLIGVDTPETIKPNSPVECYGVAASNNLKSLLSAKTVRLESDPINQNRDRYDRLLRYVYTQEGTLVNEQIIREGFGFAYLSFPFTKAEEFRLAQVDARQNNRGVWGGQCDITNPNGDRPKTNEL
ncbi:thermonuclease family protein [Candidatus Saccharibacteria bacterium]|nr:thermonuclease family protein [Candidatus Saccharibacteria bacterium]MCB9817085.1 thermonuclease family protein [Candidatus Nomurabacteria bacterium]HPD98767.1 thermonuclease family protein [Candidatus Saccharibacteria bacterium]